VTVSPIRVLHLFVTLPVGGAENLLLSILRQLDPTRYESVVCTLGERGILATQVEALGVPLVELGLMRGGSRGRAVQVLAELLRRERIDLLHAHLYHANLIGRLAARRAGIPAVISIHNTYTRPKWHRRFINWWLARSYTGAIIAGSAEIRCDILRYDHVPTELVEVIPNAVDLSRSVSTLTRQVARERLGLAPDAYVLGTVGRLEEQKGHRFLLDALYHLRAEGLETVLLLVGGGREVVALREQAARLALGDRVRFLGMRDDLGDLFRAMDLFVMPSLWEGLSLAMLSAMAAELPVVATNVGGVPEVLGDDERGFVVPPGDAVALADRIAWCHDHPDAVARAGTVGATHVCANYSDAALVKRVEAVYERVYRARR
jgi:glycosyltransferase involved in cell wall biosynthesis